MNTQQLTPEQIAAQALQTRNENIEARTVIDDPTGTAIEQPEIEAGERQQIEPQERSRPIQMSPSDEMRANMAKRFRRAGDSVPFNGDANDPEMQFGDVARQTLMDEEPGDEEPEQVSRTQPAQRTAADQPRKWTIKVRGRDVEMTDDEIIAKVQKIEAADSYFEDARQMLEAAKEIKREGRTGDGSQHPESRTGARDDGRDSDQPAAETRHPGSRIKEVVEKIQFGDPEEAAQALAEAIDESADRSSDKRQLKRLMDNDTVKSRKALVDFVAANPDLNQDEIAAQVIEQNLYRIYHEDIVKLGVADLDKIPDPRTNPRDLAEWHRFYRVHGHNVKSTSEALEEAKTRVMKWRGPAPKTADARQPQKLAPTVKVNVERTARREMIPNNPTRSASPRPNLAPPVSQERTRSSVIANMKKQRGQATV